VGEVILNFNMPINIDNAESDMRGRVEKYLASGTAGGR